MLFQLLFFLLPGWCCGALAAAAAAGVDGPEALIVLAAAAAAAGLATRFCRRRGLLNILGAAAFLALTPPPGSPAMLAVCGAVGGAVAALPERWQRGRQAFALAAAAAVLTGYFGGWVRLDSIGFLCSALLAGTPAALVLIFRCTRGRRTVRTLYAALALLTVLTNLATGRLMPPDPIHRSLTSRYGRIDLRYHAKAPKDARLAVTYSGGDILRMPRDRTIHNPAVLPAALQPDRPALNVLVLSEALTGAPFLMQELPFVARLDFAHTGRAPGMENTNPVSGRNFSAIAPIFAAAEAEKLRYDLIFVSEAPGASIPAQLKLFRRLANRLLAAGGVMVLPNTPPVRDAFPNAVELPGANRALLAWSAEPQRVSADLTELDRRLTRLTDSAGEVLPPGMLPALYQLLPQQPPPQTVAPDPRQALHSRLFARFAGGPTLALALALLAGYLGVRLWGGRYPHAHLGFGAAEIGAALTLALLSGCRALELEQLFSGFAAPALAALLPAAQPLRGRGGENRPVWTLLLLILLLPPLLQWSVMPVAAALLLAGIAWCAGRALGSLPAAEERQAMFWGMVGVPCGAVLFWLFPTPAVALAAALLIPRLIRI